MITLAEKEVNKNIYDFNRWLTQLSLDTGVIIKEASLTDVATGKSLGILVYNDKIKEYGQK